MGLAGRYSQEDIAGAAFEALAMAEDPLAFEEDDDDEDNLERW